MDRLKYSFLLLLIFVLFSCNNSNRQKEIIENRIRQINGMVSLFKNHIDERGAAISNISTLGAEKKAAYHYDSLVRVQEWQIKAVKVFQHQVDSLKGVLSQLK